MADTLDNLLAAQANRTTQANGMGGDSLDNLLQTQARAATGNAAPIAANGTGSTWLDTGNAIGTGFQKGLLRLAGLPVDTMSNVRDLAKAGAGSVYQAVTGKTAPDFLQLGDDADD